MAMTLKLKLSKTKTHHSFCWFAYSYSYSYSYSYGYYHHHPHKDHHFLCAISEAIIETNSLDSSLSLRRILPSIKPHHVTKLINLNPLSLPPSSLLSFFNWLASRPPFRHTLHSYCTMAHFLCSHRMLPEAHSLLCFLVSRKGNDSASSLFASILQTMPAHHSILVFDALISAYTDSGFIPDAVQCFRLARKNNLPIPLHACGHLLHQMGKSKPPESSWAFYLEILDYGYPPKVYNFNVLMHGFCKIGDIGNAQLVFDEILKRSLRPTVVSFNTLISGYCKSGNLREGFRLKGVMESERVCPDVFTFSALINGLCKESRLD